MGNKCAMSARKGKANSLKKNNLKTKYPSKFEEYKCKIKTDKTEVFGFFCNLGNSEQNIFIPTIITRKDSFNENFNFDGNYFIKIYNNNNWIQIYLNKIYLSDKHNIVILLILKDNFNTNNISFLEIPNYEIFENKSHYTDNEQYLLFYLKNEEIEFSDCLNIKVDQKDYTFEYSCSECKDAFYILIINRNRNELVGIHMKRKNNKGILIKGIIKEIQNNQIDSNLKDIDNINYKMFPLFQEKESKDINKLPQNKDSKQKNNESFMDNIALEEKIKLDKLKVFCNEKNDIDVLQKKSSFKFNKHMKFNNNNSNSSSIKQSNVDKNIHFRKRKNDNSGKNIDFINNIENREKYSSKSNNNDTNNQIFEEQEKKSNLKEIKNEIVDIKKQSESQNTQNGYEKNDNSNKKLNNIDNNGEEISLYFEFNNGKELYLDVKDSCIFEDIIKQLNKKYLWLKNIAIKEYKINNESICINKTAKQNKLVNNSIIKIIECS